jgi:hypothetical protein
MPSSFAFEFNLRRYTMVTVLLPLWPGLSGAAALAPALDPQSVPPAAASVGGGGGAALYSMPARDGAPAMRMQNLAPPGPRGKSALEAGRQITFSSP